MIISIFGGTVLRPGMEDAETQAMDRLIPIYVRCLVHLVQVLLGSRWRRHLYRSLRDTRRPS